MGFANKISLSRILVIPFFIAALFFYSAEQTPHLRWLVLFIFCFAMITDFIDGIVARLKKEKTVLGKILDPLADKLLLLNAFIWIYHLKDVLPLKYSLPLGVVIIIVSRDVIILVGLLILYLLKVEIPISPNIWGKLTTLFQLTTILSLLLDLPVTPVLWSLACLFTIISGILYIRRGVIALNVIDGAKNNSGMRS